MVAQKVRQEDIIEVVDVEVPFQTAPDGRPVPFLTPVLLEICHGRKRRGLTGDSQESLFRLMKRISSSLQLEAGQGKGAGGLEEREGRGALLG